MPQPQGLPYEILKPPAARTLTWNAFQVGAQIPGVLSQVAYMDVPLSHLLLVRPGQIMRAYIKARHEAAIAPDANPTVSVDLAAQGLKPIRSTRQAPAFPTQSHPDVHAYISSDAGTTWDPANVTAVNWNTGVVTVAKLATTNRVKIYFLPGDGEFEIRVLRPVGSDGVNAKLFGMPFRMLHELNQANVRTALRLGITSDLVIPSQFRISLEARTPATVVWNAEAQHELAIGVYDTPVRIVDLQRLNVEAEKMLRGGNF